MNTSSGVGGQSLVPAQHGSRQKSSVVTNILPFIVGGTSGIIATICVQPLDMIKVRLQLSDKGTRNSPKQSSLTVIRSILSIDGVLGFYRGLSAALARQVVYGTSRLGLFAIFEDVLKSRAQNNHTEYGFSQRVLASVGAGGLGAAFGNPAEVALIRMQANSWVRPKGQRENYRSVVDAIVRITRQEGLGTLWSGCFPTVIRAMSTNFGQLAFFSETKHQLRACTSLSEQTQSLIASGVGGFCAAFFSMPFDFVKSRLQSQQKLPDGRAQYGGILDCLMQVRREEGLRRLYRGFPAYFSRMAPHSVISLVIMDKLWSLIR